MFFEDIDSWSIAALIVAALVTAIFRQNARLQRLERRVAEIELGRANLANVPLQSEPKQADTPRPAPAVPIIPARWASPGPAETSPAGTDLPPRSAPAGSGPASPPPRTGLEERLGTRWAVWVGGLALALGGVLLVRYSVEQGLVGPGLRVALGAAFALALVAAGEWLRQREQATSTAINPRANIPAVLTAAGTSTAFAVIYAACSLYGLIGPGPAFILLGLVALATMIAAALHGPALAGLGLAAALGSPLLVDSDDPNIVALVLYLGFVAGAAYGLARMRLWRWLAVAAAFGALAWGVLIILEGTVGVSMAHALLQMGLATAFLVLEPYRRVAADAQPIDRLASVVLLGFGLLAILVAGQVGAGSARPLFGCATVALLLAAGWRFPPVAPAVAIAATIATGILAFWPVAYEASLEPVRVLESFTVASPFPDALWTYVFVALLFATSVAGVGLLRVAVGPGLRPAATRWYLGAATVGPFALLLLAFGRVTALQPSYPFALVAAALGAVYAMAAAAFRRQEDTLRLAGVEVGPAHLAVGGTATAAIGALALGLTMALDRGLLTVSLALTALGAAFVAERAAVPALRFVTGALGLIVAARLAWDPRVVGGDLGQTPIFNWLLFGYGTPALAFALSGRLLARSGRDRAVRVCETLGILLSAILVFLEIRHALNGGDIYASSYRHLEAGLVVTQGLGFSLLAARLGSRTADPLYRIFSLGFAAVSVVGAAVTLGLFSNPLFTGEPLAGGALLNTLAPAYLIPAAIAALLAVASRGVQPRGFVLAAGGLAVALELAFAFLETRVLFQGPAIGVWRRTSEGEVWAYSFVLLANGVALLTAGFIWASREARLASALCIVVVVLKVFLVDMARLEGLLRALSFVGLGLALVAIGLAYQRLMSRTRAGELS